MARHQRHLVIWLALVTLWLVAGCAPPDLPHPVYIDASFSAEQQEIIIEAIDRWNEVGEEYYGSNVLNLKGIYNDSDGFDTLVDQGDERNVIYNAPPEIYDFLAKRDPNRFRRHKVTGYSGVGDILLFVFNMLEKDGSLDSDMFLHTALHELGHGIGLSHVYDTGVMCQGNCNGTGPALDISIVDVQELCRAHECANEP